MAKTRTLEVVISGDPKQLTRAFGNIDKSAAGTEGRLKRMGKVGALAFGGLAAAAGGAAVIGLKKSADAAIEAEKAQARMTAQLKASGISYQAHAKQIDAVIQRTSKLAGLDDEDLQDAFTNIVRSTGSVDKGLRNIGLAADIARAKHLDVAKAGQLVGRVATGNVTALSRYGIQIDKNATSSEALAELQRRFSGQAEAYGKTTAGSMERAGVAAENLGEAVGAKLAPLVAKGADALTNLIDRSGEAAGPIRRITGTIANAYNAVRNAVTRFARTNREDIAAVVTAVRNLGRFFKNVFEDVILPAVRAALPGVRQALNGIITVVRGIVRVVSGIINGDWRRVWAGLKDIVRGAINGVVGVVRAAVGGIGTALVNAGKGLGKAIVRGIVSAFTGIGGAIKDKLGDAVGALNPFGDGLGKQIGEGLGKIPSLAPLPTPRAGGASGSLMGADSALAPFAAVGARFGLRVSSGLRPGATTAIGASYHSSGEAVDLANGRGPDPAKLATFRALKSSVGSRLAELIYTPGGVGIKDGRPHTYTGQVAADHFDHVHVALDLGRPGPGIGDGPGKKTRAGEMKWLSSMWGKIAPLFGLSGKTPIAGLFKHVRLSGSSPFVGVATDPGKGNETADLLWPSWVWRSSKGQAALDNKTKQKLFIHEMAHRFQVPGATKSEWEAEGGAEAFARIAMSRKFGGYAKDPSDPYNSYSKRVMKEHGWGWVTKTQFGKGDGLGRKRFTGDGPGLSGINLAIDAARRAGFRGEALVRMVAIAGRESNYNPRAQNLVPPDHSIGFWQINQLAHHGRFGSDAELMNPYTNARAAWILSNHGHNFSPWSTNRGLSGALLDRARRAVAAFGGGSATTSGGTSTSGGGGGGGGSAATPDTTNPYELAIAGSDVEIAEAQQGGVRRGAGGRVVSSPGLRETAAQRNRLSIVNRRIAKVQKALKRHLKPATRLRLRQELASLLGERSTIRGRIDELATLPESAGADSGAGTTVDSSGDTEGGGQDNQALIDAIAANTAAQEEAAAAAREHASQLQGVRDELKRQTDFATTVQSTESFQLKKYLADVLSGQIGGYGVAPRSYTPGTGVAHAY